MELELAQWLRTLVVLPGFDSQHPQPSVTLVSGDMMPSSGLCRHQVQMWCSDIHASPTQSPKKLSLELLGGYDSKDTYTSITGDTQSAQTYMQAKYPDT